jgi:hypothetical protein
LHLRNGTDARGDANPLIENKPVTLTEEAVENKVAMLSIDEAVKTTNADFGYSATLKKS